MTATTLRSYTAKDLAQMARQQGVAGWHGMRKDELISALVQVDRQRPKGKSVKSNGNTTAEQKLASPNRKATSSKVARTAPTQRPTPPQIAGLQQHLAQKKNLSSSSENNQGKVTRDRLVVMVRDPYWLHAYWELTPQSIDRARTALGQHWHTAVPVLRLSRGNDGGGSAVEKVVEIHGGVNHWYLNVNEPPKSYRLEIGYYTPGAPFYCIARSNTVTTPTPGAAELVDSNWADVAENADQIYAMSGGYSHDGASVELQELLEERLRRRLGRPSETRFGNGAAVETRGDELRLAVDAELIVFGSTERHTHVTVQGEPVQVQPDGNFAVKLNFPDRRQVVPIVASSADGVEQKTIILGVERNTKMLAARVADQSSS